MSMPLTLSRVNKLSHSDTILYEIYMLRFSCERMIRGKWEHERDAWLCLESFLVHYRNLIEFLGKPQDEIKNGEIHITNIWRLEKVAAPNGVEEMHKKGQILWMKYERQEDRISRYLQHCTTKRVDAKDWQIDEMVSEIETLLSEVEKVLKPSANLLKPV